MTHPSSRRNPRDLHSQKRIHAKRERRRLKSLRRNRRKRARPRPSPPRHGILQFYASRARIGPGKHSTRQVDIAFPPTFSFIENPEETLATVEAIIRAAMHKQVKKVRMNQRACELIDLGAEAIVSVIAEQMSTYQHKSLSGILPDDWNLQQVVVSVGMPRVLGLSTPQPGFVVFDLFHGKKEGYSPDANSLAELATGNLVQHIDTCLGTYGYALTSKGKRSFANLVGEVITNAEEHSGRRDWWVAAYLQRRSGGR